MHVDHLLQLLAQSYSIMDRDLGFLAAIEEAKCGADEGGVPIGACLISHQGNILGRGHNMRVQKGSATLHVGFNDQVMIKSRILMINASVRPRSRHLRIREDSPRRPTKGPLCTRLSLLVTCALAPVFCTKLVV